MEFNRKISSDEVLNKLDTLLQKNDYTGAKNHLLYWLAEAEYSGDKKITLLITNELMGLCRKLAEKDEAIGYTKKALELINEMNIQDNTGAATTYLNCATVYKAFGKPEESIPLFVRAQAIYEKNLAPEDDRFGGLYNNMALAFVDLKDFDTANKLYEKALTVMGNIKNKEPEQAITLLNMANAAEAQYGLEEAHSIIEAHLKNAMELLDTGKNRNDGNYAFVCEKCAPTFGYYGYFYYENELKERARSIYERS